MLELSLNLSFNGNCREAFEFYEKVFAAKIHVMMTWGDSPMAKEVPADWAEKITHASMSFGARELTGGDTPGSRYEKPQGFSVILNLTEVAEAERIFHALADGGKVKVPFAETFWAARFAMLTDRFGIPWMVNCGKPQ